MRGKGKCPSICDGCMRDGRDRITKRGRRLAPWNGNGARNKRDDRKTGMKHFTNYRIPSIEDMEICYYLSVEETGVFIREIRLLKWVQGDDFVISENE